MKAIEFEGLYRVVVGPNINFKDDKDPKVIPSAKVKTLDIYGNLWFEIRNIDHDYPRLFPAASIICIIQISDTETPDTETPDVETP